MPREVLTLSLKSIVRLPCSALRAVPSLPFHLPPYNAGISHSAVCLKPVLYLGIKSFRLKHSWSCSHGLATSSDRYHQPIFLFFYHTLITSSTPRKSRARGSPTHPPPLMSTVTQKTSTSRRNLPLDATTLKSPKPNHHLYLNKPLVGNASNVSVNDIVPPSTPTPGLRAHLGQLLPRHALFRAKIVIHQISSVPFVGGEFGVRWKFKSVQAPNAQKQGGLLQRVKSRNGSRIDKGKGREDAGTESLSSQSAPPTYTTASSSSTHASSSVSSRSSETAYSQQQYLSAGAWPSTPSAPSFLDSSNNSSAITLAPPSPSGIPASSTPARGMTPYLKLKDHSVVWSQTLDPILKFDIDRETTQILPNPLKLVVIQRINHEDPHGSPQNPRLGAVYLNLAEYINQGNVERRYLLKESKTNATLKVFHCPLETTLLWLIGH